MEVNPKVKEHIQLAKAGKTSGFNYLINSHWDFVYQFMFKRCNNDAYLTEEIVIQSFAKAFDKIDQFDESYEFSTWIVQIAKNKHIDYMRKKELPTTQIERETKSKIIGNQPSIEDSLIEEQKTKDLQQHIQNLPLQYREIIELRYLEELSFQAISEKLDLPINTLKVRALRAKKQLFNTMTSEK